MDEPVTDVVFVSSKDNCPEGYRIIETCPCGHEAQLWEKVLGGESGKRYLCFTKEEKDDLVIEDMYIPGRSAQYLYKGYKIVDKTVEGDDPMYHKQLAVKKVPRTHANKVIADIIICRSRDNVSKMYKKLDKVNGLCICFRPVDLGGRNTPSPKPTRRGTTTSISSSSSSTSAPVPRSQRGGSLNIGDLQRHMAGVNLSDGGPSYRRASSPSSAIRRTVSPLVSHTQQRSSSTSPSPSPQPPSPQPPSPPRTGEMTSVQSTLPPSSPPPPSAPYVESTNDFPPPSAPPPAPPSTSTYPTTNSYYPPSTASNYPSSTTRPSNYPPNYPPPAANSHPPPPQVASPYLPPPPPSNYPPPHGTSYQTPPLANTTTYPPPPGPAPYGGGALGFGGVTGGIGQPPPSSSAYPPYTQQLPPGGYGGYGAVAGPSFATAPVVSHNPSGPAPYNPYQSQQGHAPHPPPSTAGQPSYGFKF